MSDLKKRVRILSEHNSNGTHNSVAVATLRTFKIFPLLYAKVTGSNFTTTSTSLVDITGLSLALEANSTYKLKAHLASNSSTAAGVEIGVNFSAAGATIRASAITFIPEARTNAPYSDRITAFNTPNAAMLGSAAYTGESLIDGIVTTGANAGNLTCQILKVTSGTATVYIDSDMEVVKTA